MINPALPYSIAIAGSTQHTVMCAQALLKDARFQISWILTPIPKPIGRKQIVTKNPLHLFAEEHHLPVVFVEKKIDETVKKDILHVNTQIPSDFLLVVDFGYLIPAWLLELPRIAPLNIHPSDLPRWRGSSPGQFVLLNGEKSSAVTLMIMDKDLDSGPLLHKEYFDVDPSWTQTEYYQHSFQLVQHFLADTIAAFAQGELRPQPQPTDSPTPLARRLSKEDGFVTWADLEIAMTNGKNAAEIEQKVRAFAPWPGVWTLTHTQKGEKRMKILSAKIENQKLQLGQVQLEGETPVQWNEKLFR